MKELIELLNDGWRVKKGFVVGSEKCVKLTKRVFTDPQTGEMYFPVAWIVENENGEIEVLRKEL